MKQTIALLLAFTVALGSGCSAPQAAPESASQQSGSGAQEGGAFRQRGPAGPEEQGKRVMGRVTAINGNELELELVEAQRGEMPQSGEGNSENAQSGSQASRPTERSGSAVQRGNAPDGQSRIQRGNSNGGSRLEGGGGPRGSGGGFGGFGGEGQTVEYKATGETLTITVPVSTPVSPMGRESTGSLTFSSITKGSVIMLAYAENEAGEEYIESIRIMQTAS